MSNIYYWYKKVRFDQRITIKNNISLSDHGTVETVGVSIHGYTCLARRECLPSANQGNFSIPILNEKRIFRIIDGNII